MYKILTLDVQLVVKTIRVEIIYELWAVKTFNLLNFKKVENRLWCVYTFFGFKNFWSVSCCEKHIEYIPYTYE